jgi:hypothetical protein
MINEAKTEVNKRSIRKIPSPWLVMGLPFSRDYVKLGEARK